MASSTQPVRDDRAPIKGYDRLALRPLIAELHEHSQTELSQIDAYERAHADRDPVLDKLRYLRSTEPLDGYDELALDEIVARLDDADLTTLHAARGYESRLRQRDDVLAGIEELRRKRVRAAGSTAAEPPVARPQQVGGLIGFVATVGVLLLVVLAAVLALVAIFVVGYIALSIIAPSTFG